MNIKKLNPITLIIGLTLTVVLVFSWINNDTRDELIINKGVLAQILKSNNILIKEVEKQQLPFHSDSAFATFIDEGSAQPLIIARGGTFTPLYLSTTIFAVDREQTDTIVHSWKDLLTCGEKIAFSSAYNDLSFVHAMNGVNNALKFFHTLQNNNKFFYTKNDDLSELFKEAPIAIIPDTEAALLVKQGMNLELILPSDGSLTVPWGIYEKEPKIKIPKQKLKNAGFRLPNGDCDTDIYPKNYSSAKKIEDWQTYGKISEYFITRFRREVLKTHNFIAANGMERLIFYLIFSLIVSIWAFSIHIRIADKRIRVLLIIQASLLLFWLFVRYLKILLYGNIFFLWYLYYIPAIFSPLIFVYTSLVASQKTEKLPNRLSLILFIISSGLLLLVLTNNLHQFVFLFTDKTIINWNSGNYTYNFGYFTVILWILGLIVYGFVLLFKNPHNSGQPYTLLAPILSLLILSGYLIAYAVRFSLIRNSEFSFITSTFILITWELSLATGLFQTNIRYIDMFTNSQIPIWILNNKLQVKYSSLIAGELPDKVKQDIRENYKPVNAPGHEIFDIIKISGGYTVWKTDISHITLLQKQLREKVKETEEQNKILQKETELKKESVIVELRHKTVKKLENTLYDKITKIKKLTKELSDPLDYQDKHKLIKIKILTGYCKRIGMLVLSGEQNGFIKTDTLGLLFSETAIDVAVAGIDCKVYYSNGYKVNNNTAYELYSTFHNLIFSLLEYEKITIFCRLMADDNSSLNLILIIDTTETMSKQNLDKLKNSLSNMNLNTSFEENSFIIKIKAGENKND